MDYRTAWNHSDFQAIADGVDTGVDRPDTSRALIIFNLSPDPLSGLIVFHVDMPWRAGRDLPPITVTHLQTSSILANFIRDIRFMPPAAGESHGRLQFDLWFPVSNVPPKGWDTYVAEYAAAVEKTSQAEATWVVDEARYEVLETLRHAGVLPVRGSTLPVD